MPKLFSLRAENDSQKTERALLLSSSPKRNTHSVFRAQDFFAQNHYKTQHNSLDQNVIKTYIRPAKPYGLISPCLSEIKMFKSKLIWETEKKECHFHLSECTGIHKNQKPFF